MKQKQNNFIILIKHDPAVPEFNQLLCTQNYTYNLQHCSPKYKDFRVK